MRLDGPVGGLALYSPFVKLRGPVGIFFAGDAGADEEDCDDVDAVLAEPVGSEPSRARGPVGGAFPDIARPLHRQRCSIARNTREWGEYGRRQAEETRLASFVQLCTTVAATLTNFSTITTLLL